MGSYRTRAKVDPPIGPPPKVGFRPVSTAGLMAEWQRTARECLGTMTAAVIPIGVSHVLMWRADPIFAAAALMLAAGLIVRAWQLQRQLSRALARIENRNRNQ